MTCQRGAESPQKEETRETDRERAGLLLLVGTLVCFPRFLPSAEKNCLVAKTRRRAFGVFTPSSPSPSTCTKKQKEKKKEKRLRGRGKKKNAETEGKSVPCEHSDSSLQPGKERKEKTKKKTQISRGYLRKYILHAQKKDERPSYTPSLSLAPSVYTYIYLCVLHLRKYLYGYAFFS